MKLLFNIESGGDVVLQDDTFRLIPELKEVVEKLGGEYLRYIVSMHDYCSPYRQLQVKERDEDVCNDIWKKEPKKVKDLYNPLMTTAKARYKSLQYDPIVEQYMVFSNKIAEYNTWIADMSINEGNAESLTRVMKSLEQITESREALKDLILKKEEESKMMGGGEVSLLEEMMN